MSYEKARSKAEYVHLALTGFLRTQCLFIEPLFEFSSAKDTEDFFGKLSGHLADFVCSRNRASLSHEHMHIEIVTSKSLPNGLVRPRPSHWHSDRGSLAALPELHVMGIVTPAEHGGENEYLPANLVVQSLESRAPDLLERLRTTPIIFDIEGQPRAISVLAPETPGTIFWNAKQLSKYNNAERTKLSHDFEQFLDSCNLEAEVYPMPRMPGAVAIWWDPWMLHRRQPEAGAATRRNILYRIQAYVAGESNSVKKKTDETSEQILTLLEFARLEIGTRMKGKEKVIIAISGINAAGKTTFALDLATHLEDLGRSVGILHVDDYHRPKIERYARPGPIAFRHSYFNFDALYKDMEAFKAGEDGGNRKVYDPFTDNITIKSSNFSNCDTLLVEGVFLLSEELSGLYDIGIYIDVSLHTAMSRGIERWNGVMPLVEILERFEDRYIPAQQAHMVQDNPLAQADIIITRRADGRVAMAHASGSDKARV